MKNSKTKKIEQKFLKITALPNQSLEAFINVFSYSNDDYYHEKIGNLFGIIQILDESEQSEYIPNLLTSVIKKEFYSQPKRSTEDSFESALKKANLALADLAEHDIINWLGKIHATVGVFKDNVLYFTQVGATTTLIGRNNKIINLSEPSQENNHPVKTFQGIVTGEVQAGDKIITATPTIQHIFNTTDLNRLFDTLTLEEFDKLFFDTIKKEGVNVGAIIINISENKQASSSVQDVDLIDDDAPIEELTKNKNFLGEEIKPKSSSKKEEEEEKEKEKEEEKEEEKEKEKEKEVVKNKEIAGSPADDSANTKYKNDISATKKIEGKHRSVNKEKSSNKIKKISKEDKKEVESTTEIKQSSNKPPSEKSPSKKPKKKTTVSENKLSGIKKFEEEKSAKNLTKKKASTKLTKKDSVQKSDSKIKNAILNNSSKRKIKKLNDLKPREEERQIEISPFEETPEIYISSDEITPAKRQTKVPNNKLKKFFVTSTEKDISKTTKTKDSPTSIEREENNELSQEKHSASFDKIKKAFFATGSWLVSIKSSALQNCKKINFTDIKKRGTKITNKLKANTNKKWLKDKILSSKAKLSSIDLKKINYSNFPTFIKNRYFIIIFFIIIILLILVITSSKKDNPPVENIDNQASQQQTITQNTISAVKNTSHIQKVATTPDDLKLINSSEKVILALSQNNKLYEIDKVSGQVDEIKAPSEINLEKIKSLVYMPTLNLFFLSSNSQVLSYSPTTHKFYNNKISLPNNFDLIDQGIYLEYLYLLDKTSGQIYRYPRDTGGFGIRKEWLKTPMNDTENVKALSIDDAIRVIRKNGTIETYFKNKLERSSNLNSQKEPTDIYTSTDLDRYYVLIKESGKVLEMNKETDKIEKEYEHSELTKTNNITVNKNSIYFFANKNIFSVNLLDQ